MLKTGSSSPEVPASGHPEGEGWDAQSLRLERFGETHLKMHGLEEKFRRGGNTVNRQVMIRKQFLFKKSIYR